MDTITCNKRELGWYHVYKHSTLAAYVVQYLTSDLCDPSVINDTIGGSEEAMGLTVRVKKGHATCNIFGKRESEVPVERNLFILQHVIQTPFGAILSNDGHIRWNII